MTIKDDDSGTLAVSYYTLPVDEPIKNPEPYKAECLDIINGLNLGFVLGTLFKAVWRIGAYNTLGRSKSGYDPRRDVQKIKTFADLLGRMYKV